MLNLNSVKLNRLSLPVSTSWLLGSCMEARGKQELWLRKKPETLQALRMQAAIQSVESSNRIEGVVISSERLRPVLLGSEKPKDRSEHELLGYKKALEWIFSRKRKVQMVPRLFQKLHRFMHGTTTGDSGEWKSRDNEIVELRPDGQHQVRFKPASARKTPGEMKRLCVSYDKASEIVEIPELVTISLLVFDLLCIHPFRDGNGRVSRLVTTLLLQQHGFEVGRYVSLERLVEDSKEEYYAVLKECSQGWHEGENEIVPWMNYFLGILNRAYKELEKKVELGENRPAKGELVRQMIFEQVEEFALADIAALVPTASPQLIRKVLSELKKAGEVKLQGRGRGAKWKVVP